MAKRRCINIDFYDSEEFCELPPRVKHLYTELILHCDDDGVVINPKAVLRICKTDKKYLDLLQNKKFLLNIDGVYIIRHWYVHNKVQPSRKVASIYGEQLSRLVVNSSNEYVLAVDSLLTDCRPDTTKPNIIKDNITEPKVTEALGSADVPTEEELCNVKEYEEYFDELYKRNSSGNTDSYDRGNRRGYGRYR